MKGISIMDKANMVGAERSAIIEIGGTPYELILTTKATKAIAGKYGGLDNLGETLLKSENFELALSEIVWLITLLANQSLLIHNLKCPDEKKDLLDEDMVELLTTPQELASYKEAIMEAMFKGTRRDVESEEQAGSKNSQAG